MFKGKQSHPLVLPYQDGGSSLVGRAISIHNRTTLEKVAFWIACVAGAKRRGRGGISRRETRAQNRKGMERRPRPSSFLCFLSRTALALRAEFALANIHPIIPSLSVPTAQVTFGWTPHKNARTLPPALLPSWEWEEGFVEKLR